MLDADVTNQLCLSWILGTESQGQAFYRFILLFNNSIYGLFRSHEGGIYILIEIKVMRFVSSNKIKKYSRRFDDKSRKDYSTAKVTPTKDAIHLLQLICQYNKTFY